MFVVTSGFTANYQCLVERHTKQEKGDTLDCTYRFARGESFRSRSACSRLIRQIVILAAAIAAAVVIVQNNAKSK